jgi:deazaflavin-dependent oxidoreductase (nitroreductase family)
VSDFNELNQQVMEEFRRNGGKVGGASEGVPLLILTATGAKSGRPRATPVVYRPDGDRYVIFATKAGAPENPSWYYNVKANPEVIVEVGTERITAAATELVGKERERLWEAQKAEYSQFAEYEETAAGRVIPLVALTRA